MHARIKYLLVGILLLATTWPAWSQAPPTITDARKKLDETTSDYLRVIRNKHDEPIALESSIVTFQDDDRQDVVVDLIGAVHIADASYFRQLNEIFSKYDALLYELVAPKHHNVPNNGQSQHPIGRMQQGMKSILNLEFQLEAINYGKKNFVHADMSPEEFSRVMNERGESFWQMMLRMMGQAMATQAAGGRGSDTDLIFALFAPDRSLRLKRVMATQFENLEGSMLAIEGPNGSTLIGQRNKKALSVLKRELVAGKKRIGIFYGAGHMPDMAARLKKDFGLELDRSSIRWLTAWDMGKK